MPYPVDSVSVIGSTVVLTLGTPIPYGESVAVSYTDPTAGDDPNATQDLAGNDAATFQALRPCAIIRIRPTVKPICQCLPQCI
ncbi:SwmB domain-containing protein [Thiorhodospira sibirica]|uniref:SwmB domain-containing protein n=1 Tax=Thiorhodospira sibirica TaxID=154347 RepID=UPI000A04640D